ncbi:RHS repeat-associated core domain-containing protein, partial [Undibacterium sp. 10I3]|uniref:RHS repeat-associated core domain-containing protein n=1 Tax=Undibacterium sp. 10I3 TaxID=3048579 RepID=UPI002B22D1CA
KSLQIPPAKTPDGDTLGWKLLDAVSNPNLVSIARCLTAKTNASGIRITQTKYEAYGMAVAGSDTPTIGFTRHVNDVDTGLTYMQQRYYDPVAGRFLSEDPVLTDENTGRGFNRYSYAQNNPYRYIDPDGRTDIEIQPIVILPAPSVTITGHRDPFVNDPFFSPVVGSPSSGPKMPSVPNLIRSGCVSMPMACLLGASIIFAKPPRDAKDPNGAEAPGKPSEADGFTDPKDGENWVKNPNGSGIGWEAKDGKVWVPTSQGDIAHGGPHWDVQDPRTGGHKNILPG